MSSAELTPGAVRAAGGTSSSPPIIYPSQQPLYELMANSITELRQSYWNVWKGITAALIFLPIGAVFGTAAVFVVATLVRWLHGKEGVIYLIAFVPLALSFLAELRRKAGKSPNIEFVRSSSGQRKLEFPRLTFTLGTGSAIYIMLMGLLFGIHVQLIYQTADHCGLNYSFSWWESAHLATVNLLDGITFGLTHTIGVDFGDRANHTSQSAWFFWPFRFVYEGFVVMVAFALVRRRSIVRLAHLFDKYYLSAPTPEGLRQYLRHVCHSSASWSKHFNDEFVFFYLVETWLSKHYATCRELKFAFPNPSVPDEVYDLFRKGGHNTCVFAAPGGVAESE